MQFGQYYDIAGGHQVRLSPMPNDPESDVLLVHGAVDLYGSEG